MCRAGRALGARLAAALVLSPLSLAQLSGEALGQPGAPADPAAVPRPHLQLSERGAGFWGPGRADADPPLPPTVRVGLLGPAGGELGVELRRGARLALERANGAGGYQGRPFELVSVATDGPWGTAAARVVRLAHDDGVWAIVGGLDGHHVHLAELVVAKLWVPVVSPWAVDRTVDYANVPWVFRCPPDDGAQAEALLRHASAATGQPPLLLMEDEREARAATERAQDAARRLGLPPLSVLRWPRTGPLEPTLDALRDSPPAAIVVWGGRDRSLAVLTGLRRRGYAGLLLAPATLAVQRALTLPDLVVAAGFDPGAARPALQALRQRYAAAYGGHPDPVAAYTYDALSLVFDAIRAAGLNRARVRDRIAATGGEGATGRLGFDGLGGGAAQVVLLRATPTGWVPIPVAAR